jgi:hypothetical protein
MTNNLLTYLKNKLPVWCLILGIFFFAGYAGNTVGMQKQAIQTELVLVHNRGAAEKKISYKNSVTVLRKTPEINNTRQYLLNVLRCYNGLIKVNFENICRQFYIIKTADHFMQANTILQNTSADKPVRL